MPLSIVSSRLIARHSVDLPEPEGPMTTTTSPRLHVEVDVLEHVQLAEPLVHAVEDHQAASGRVAAGSCSVAVMGAT